MIATTVVCPRCKAAAGESCRGIVGVHQERIRLHEAASKLVQALKERS